MINFSVYDLMESAVTSLHHKHCGFDFFDHEFAVFVLDRLRKYGEDHDGQALHDGLMDLLAGYVVDPQPEAEPEAEPEESTYDAETGLIH